MHTPKARARLDVRLSRKVRCMWSAAAVSVTKIRNSASRERNTKYPRNTVHAVVRFRSTGTSAPAANCKSKHVPKERQRIRPSKRRQLTLDLVRAAADVMRVRAVTRVL